MEKSPSSSVHGADDGVAADRAKATRERAEPTVGQPGGFNNDPNDATNPNEAIERHRRKLRPDRR